MHSSFETDNNREDIAESENGQVEPNLFNVVRWAFEHPEGSAVLAFIGYLVFMRPNHIMFYVQRDGQQYGIVLARNGNNAMTINEDMDAFVKKAQAAFQQKTGKQVKGTRTTGSASQEEDKTLSLLKKVA